MGAEQKHAGSREAPGVAMGAAAAALPSRSLSASSAARRRPVHATDISDRVEPLVLVVDPDASARSLLTLGLSRQGFSVIEEENAASALERLRSGGPLPSLVICETDLHTTDGFTFLTRLREESRTAAVSVLVVSRQTDDGLREQALRAGADAFLPKPFRLTDLVALSRLLTSPVNLSGAFEAPLQTLPLVPLLRALLAGKRSGRIDVGGQGHLVFREGRVVDAAVGHARGLPGLTRLLLLVQGMVSVSFEAALVPATFSLGIAELQEGVFPTVDRWTELLGRSVPLDAVFEVHVPAFSRALDRLPDSVNSLVRLFDGHRTVRECVFEGPLDEVTALKVCTRLYLMGIVTAIRPGSATTPRTPRVIPMKFEKKNRRRNTGPMLALPMIPSVSAEQLASAGQAIPIGPPQSSPSSSAAPVTAAVADTSAPFAPVSGFELPKDPFADLASSTASGAPPAWALAEDGVESSVAEIIASTTPTPVGDAWAALELDPSLARQVEAFKIQEVTDMRAHESVEEIGPEDLVFEESEAGQKLAQHKSQATMAADDGDADGETPTSAETAYEDFTFSEFLSEFADPPQGSAASGQDSVLSPSQVANVDAVSLPGEAKADAQDEGSQNRVVVSDVQAFLRGEPTQADASIARALGAEESHALPPELDMSFLDNLRDPQPARRVERRKGFEVPVSLILLIGVALVAGAAWFVIKGPSDFSQPRDGQPAPVAVMDDFVGPIAPPELLAPKEPMLEPLAPAPKHEAAPLLPKSEPVLETKPEPVKVEAPKASTPELDDDIAVVEPVLRKEEKPKAAAAPPKPVAVNTAPKPAPKPVAKASVAPAAEEISLARGIQLYDQGKVRQAVKVLTQVVETMPTSAQAWLMLGLANFDAGIRGDALTAAKKTLELDPNNERGIMLLATIYLESGDNRRGRLELEKYLRVAPKGVFANEARMILQGR